MGWKKWGNRVGNLLSNATGTKCQIALMFLTSESRVSYLLRKRQCKGMIDKQIRHSIEIPKHRGKGWWNVKISPGSFAVRITGSHGHFHIPQNNNKNGCCQLIHPHWQPGQQDPARFRLLHQERVRHPQARYASPPHFAESGANVWQTLLNGLFCLRTTISCLFDLLILLQSPPWAYFRFLFKA